MRLIRKRTLAGSSLQISGVFLSVVVVIVVIHSVSFLVHQRYKKPSSSLEDEGVICLSWYHHHLSLLYIETSIGSSLIVLEGANRCTITGAFRMPATEALL